VALLLLVGEHYHAPKRRSIQRSIQEVVKHT